MLHLANGESTAALLRSADLPGTVASADDILMEGPPADARKRAQFLEFYLDIPADQYATAWAARLELLAGALDEDEAILWFEEDVFCQLNYLHALSWLAQRITS